MVTFEADQAACAYVRETGLSWPLLIDQNKKLYQAYGMLTAGLLDIWGPRTLWLYLREILHGHFPQKSAGDVRQRGGDVLIDPAGQVRLHHIGRGPADRPPVETILGAVTK